MNPEDYRAFTSTPTLVHSHGQYPVQTWLNLGKTGLTAIYFCALRLCDHQKEDIDLLCCGSVVLVSSLHQPLLEQHKVSMFKIHGKATLVTRVVGRNAVSITAGRGPGTIISVKVFDKEEWCLDRGAIECV